MKNLSKSEVIVVDFPSQLDTKIKEYSCPVCLLSYSHKIYPKSLTCGHSLCALCLSNLNTSSKNLCPVCKKSCECEFGKIRKNYLLTDILGDTGLLQEIDERNFEEEDEEKENKPGNPSPNGSIEGTPTHEGMLRAVSERPELPEVQYLQNTTRRQRARHERQAEQNFNRDHQQPKPQETQASHSRNWNSKEWTSSQWKEWKQSRRGHKAEPKQLKCTWNQGEQ